MFPKNRTAVNLLSQDGQFTSLSETIYDSVKDKKKMDQKYLMLKDISESTILPL